MPFCCKYGLGYLTLQRFNNSTIHDFISSAWAGANALKEMPVRRGVPAKLKSKSIFETWS